MPSLLRQVLERIVSRALVHFYSEFALVTFFDNSNYRPVAFSALNLILALAGQLSDYHRGFGFLRSTLLGA